MNSREIASVAIYVSALDRQTAEMPLAELRKYATVRSWTVGGEYTDPSYQDSRPSLDQLLSALHEGKFDAVLVWRNSDARPGLVLNPPNPLPVETQIVGQSNADGPRVARETTGRVMA